MDKTLNPIRIGVDVGQINDPTAICVTEITQIHTGQFRTPPRPGLSVDPVMASYFTVRQIQRLPLNTSYPIVAERLASMLCNPLFADRKVSLLIDVTGVGRPVYDDLQAAIKLRPEAKKAILKPITFTHGEKYNRSTGALAKAYLVSRLQSLLQGGYVHAPDNPEVRAMLEELRTYEITISQDGHDSYGAQTGKHDDLATALGLSVLEDPFAPKTGGGVTALIIKDEPLGRDDPAFSWREFLQ